MDKTVPVIHVWHSGQLIVVVVTVGRSGILDHLQETQETADDRVVRRTYFSPCLQTLGSPRVKMMLSVLLNRVQTSSHLLAIANYCEVRALWIVSGEWRSRWGLD